MSEPRRPGPSKRTRNTVAAGAFLLLAGAVVVLWAATRDDAPDAPPPKPGVVSPRDGDVGASDPERATAR